MGGGARGAGMSLGHNLLTRDVIPATGMVPGHSLLILSLDLKAGSATGAQGCLWYTATGRVKPFRMLESTANQPQLQALRAPAHFIISPARRLWGKSAKRKSHTCAPPPRSNTACTATCFCLVTDFPQMPAWLFSPSDNTAVIQQVLTANGRLACAPGSNAA